MRVPKKTNNSHRRFDIFVKGADMYCWKHDIRQKKPALWLKRLTKIKKSWSTSIIFNALAAFFNPSRSDRGRKETINLNFYFHTSLRCLRKFYEGLKAFMKPFVAPQRSLKIKIYVSFFSTVLFWNARDGKV